MLVLFYSIYGIFKGYNVSGLAAIFSFLLMQNRGVFAWLWHKFVQYPALSLTVKGLLRVQALIGNP